MPGAQFRFAKTSARHCEQAKRLSEIGGFATMAGNSRRNSSKFDDNESLAGVAMDAPDMAEVPPRVIIAWSGCRCSDLTVSGKNVRYWVSTRPAKAAKAMRTHVT